MKNIILIILAMITVSCVKTTVYTEYEKSAPIEIKSDRIKLDNKLSHCDNLFVIDSNLVILNTKILRQCLNFIQCLMLDI